MTPSFAPGSSPSLKSIRSAALKAKKNIFQKFPLQAPSISARTSTDRGSRENEENLEQSDQYKREFLLKSVPRNYVLSTFNRPKFPVKIRFCQDWRLNVFPNILRKVSPTSDITSKPPDCVLKEPNSAPICHFIGKLGVGGLLVTWISWCSSLKDCEMEILFP